MKSKILSMVTISIVFGGLITWGFTAQMNWKAQDNCVEEVGLISANVSRIDCGGLEYGYPMRFIKAESYVSQSYLTQDTSGPVQIGVASQIKYNQLNLLLNVLIWSIFSLVVLSVIISRYSPRKSNPKK